MAHDDHIRAKAIELRIARRMTIDEIGERLGLSRSTIYHWVRDLPIERTAAQSEAQARAAAANAERYRLKREAAYADGVAQYAELAADPTFRDFLCLYIGEGYKRNRNSAAIANSDADVLRVAVRWMRRLTPRPLSFWLQYHADQDVEVLRRYWAAQLDIPDPESIKLQRKSNSNQLAGRTWRSRYGVLSARVSDTMFRARLQAWMDLIREEWT